MKKIWENKKVRIAALFTLIAGTIALMMRSSDATLVLNCNIYSLPNWEANYGHMVTTNNCATVQGCSVEVDLEKLAPSEISVIDTWLRTHSDYVCYDESYKFIEDNHRVDNFYKKWKIDRKKESFKRTFSDFINGIQDFDNLKYGDYVNFTRNPTTSIVDYKHKASYVKGDMSLSIPTIKSIIARNNIATQLDSCTVTLSLDDKAQQISIIVEKTTGTNQFKKYYNYSTDPTRPTRTTFFNLFDQYFIY